MPQFERKLAASMVLGLLILIFFQFLGEASTMLLGLVIPGPVIGMVYFFFALMAWPKLKDQVLDLSRFISSYLALFFVPAGVGLIEYFDLFGRFGTAMAVTLIASTFITLAVTAWFFNFLLRTMSVEEPRD